MQTHKITKAKLTNFQIHRTRTVEFTDGFNVICGNSGKGKSAIVRAISWVLFNNLRGFAFKRTKAKKTEVELEMDSGIRVKRTKSKTVNRYELTEQFTIHRRCLINDNQINIDTTTKLNSRHQTVNCLRWEQQFVHRNLRLFHS